MYLPGLIAVVALAPLVSEPAAIRPGTITAMADRDRAVSDSVEGMFVDAVQHALLKTLFLPLPNPSHSRYVATIAVFRTPRGVVASSDRGSSSGSSVSYGGGGLALSLPSKKAQLRGLIETRLKVTVSLRGDDRVVWTGQAITVRVDGTRNGEPSVIATTLSDALMARFPYRLTEPLSVP